MEDAEDFDDRRGDDFSGRFKSEEDSTREPSRKFREAVVKVLSAMTAEPRPLRSKFGTTAVCSSTDAKRRKVFRVLFSRTFEYVLLAVVFGHFVVLSMLSAENDEMGAGESGTSSNGRFQTLIHKPLWAIDFTVLIFYTCEMALKMYALGVHF